ncbi:Na+/H+ antiporter subunit E [Rubripirellula amarantea]|uniref:Na(+)/H(+) antiporter subunit E n=1 Tax=Rubripirellula amarantea TaxID=2527999 RepID=A0A5C5WBW5_9BACT|nr:Na+/H+ antiporter subunit E [Rubripirellula amarantea]MDA8743442.1 Na+/H+ antiporter subunit E [Rubripirellula amarantea]TWT48134.1 Na(+)/H(+) antiporter subunit E [Rubripirellula amarantea]
MKYTFTLTLLLIVNWLFWSGHFDNIFLLSLGFLSCVFSVWLSRRMNIVDEEGAPAQLGIRPFVYYAPWLAREIVVSNIEVAKIVLSPVLKLRRNLITIRSSQQSELGRVMLANSITLTPGTVSVDMKGRDIHVHALNLEGAEDDLSGEMDIRICKLEKTRKCS